MSWYYSFKGKQKGPVSACDLLVLESSGLINGNSVIWAEGMPEWRTLDSVREQVSVEAGDEDLSKFAVCAHSQDVGVREEMVTYGDNLILAEHKDAFVQSLHEGTTLSDQLVKGEMRYVGFWWRVLAATIDSMVKGAINMLFMIPLGVFAVPALEKLSNDGGPPDPNVAGGVVAGFIGAYIFMILATFLAGLVYEVWMVGKYGGTVGKLALRFRVVNADGTRVSYGKSFGRWAAEVLGKCICFTIAYGVSILIVVLFGAALGGDEPSPIWMIVIAVIVTVVVYLACFPWWMAAHSKEKKALHDVICGTRVVFK